MKSAAWASTPPAWDLDGQLHCACGHTSDGQAAHLAHVISAHPNDDMLASRILSARQFKCWLSATGAPNR